MYNQNLKPNRFWQAGFFTLEILLAMAILIIVLSGAVLTISNSGGGINSSLGSSRSLNTDTRAGSEALRFAQANLEKAQSQAVADFFHINTGTVSNDIYTAIVTTGWSETQDYAKWIKSRVTWDMGNRAQYVELDSLVTDPASAARGDTCNPALDVSDWAAPKLLGSYDLTGDSGATDLDVRSRKIYLTTNPVAAGKDDFYIIDVTKPLAPVELSSINTGIGLKAVTVFGHYAYVASVSTSKQLQVIDIQNPANPQVVGELALKNGVIDCVGAGNSIYYQNGLVYLGLTKDTNCPEFNIINVSDPKNPIKVGDWEVGAQVNAIKMNENDVAYLATAYSTEDDAVQPYKGNLIVLNVKTPDNISFKKSFSAKSKTDSTLMTSLAGESVFLNGNDLYFGRSVEGADNHDIHELFVLDASTLTIKGSANVGDSVVAEVIRSGILFVTTSDPNDGFQIWNVSDPSTIIDRAYSMHIPEAAIGGMDCEENLFYVALRSNGALGIIGPKSVPTSEYALGVEGDIDTLQGQEITRMITATKVAGYPEVNLSVSGVPIDATYSLSKTTCNPNPDCNSILAIKVGNATPAGKYTIVINGTDGVTALFTLTVKTVKATPNIAVMIYDAGENEITGTTAGATIHASAEISGGDSPTGAVDFYFYETGDCTGSASLSGANIALVGGIADPSVAQGPLSIGVYSFKAHYSGDSQNESKDACVMIEIQKITPTISVLALPSGLVAEG